jgi:alpha-amylase/alpha-mannosidase (GH57 family)
MRYVCIHGHFYQPPRENPWLESVEPQDSALPYHDWNERVTAECYAPNTASRILDGSDRIVDIQNNYSRMSFDFGPTLLSWLETRAPDVYQSILEADRESRERFSGHGSAMAQVYNHAILPLATPEEKDVQVAWGIRDFEYRFGRKPEGMWLAETAVDLETLDSLASRGILFTVLAPSQAARVRPLRGGPFQDASGGRIDTTRAYLQRLPSGRSIALFFYHGPASRAVAFEGLLHRGDAFARRVSETASEGLAHIATDGETYGHHHAHGDMALAFALHAIGAQDGSQLTNYGEFLEKFPPGDEVEIRENTSWSCAHGIERWRSDCGCHTGGQPGWTQAWRRPLRDALDWLRDRARGLARARLETVFTRPADAVVEYIDVVLDRDPARVVQFLRLHGRPDLAPSEQVSALKHLELERQLHLMYTSCGWFFNDVSGIETIQILRYAGRAVQLAEDLFATGIEPEFLEKLSRAKSNRPEVGSAREIYERDVRPARVRFESLAAHYAISSLFESYPEKTTLYCYDVERQELDSHRAGKSKLLVGRVCLTSRITWASDVLGFVALHLGDHNVTAGVERRPPDERHSELATEVSALFRKGDTTSLVSAIHRRFGGQTFDLKSLFRDEQRKIVERLVSTTLEEVESAHRQIYEHHIPTMRFLAELGVPPSRALSATAEVVLNGALRRALAQETTDEIEVSALLSEAANEGVALDHRTLSFWAEKGLWRLTETFSRDPDNLDTLRSMRLKVRLLRSLPFEVDLWKVQNRFFHLATRLTNRTNGSAAESAPGDWLDEVSRLAEELSFEIPGLL